MAPLLNGAATKLATPSLNCWAANPAPGGFGYSDVGGHPAPSPALWQNSLHTPGVLAAMNAVNCADVPEPSERMTGLMGRLGNDRPLLSLLIWGSFQFLILPVKIFATVSGDSRRSSTR